MRFPESSSSFVVAFIIAVTAPVAAQPAPGPAAPTPEAPSPTVPPPVPVVESPGPAPVPPAPTQLKIELGNGTSIRFGLLWQAQYEARGNSANDGVTQNLFLRRFALLLGGTVLRDFEYFFDSDFADLLKAPTGDQSLKNGPGFQPKDALATYKTIGDQFKIDGGLFLPAGSHNSLQGGGSIYSWDFFANTFRHSTAFGTTANPYGRDLGVQARGLLFDGLLEYRAGVFQGLRVPPSATKPAGRNPFRVAGRVQLNLLDPETVFFYAGTYLGTKRIFSIGATADFQYDDSGSYRSFGGDAFVDVPVGPGGITAQVDVVHRNGGAIVTALPKQTFIGLEAGYRFDAVKLSPIGRFEKRWQTGADESGVGGGLAWWAFGHTSNLKAFYSRIIPGGDVKGFDQFNLQWQLAFY
jgi:hypothetical protein